ncbi:MAG: hypothetical protein U0Z53_19180 [Blastocatellia bacterium]
MMSYLENPLTDAVTFGAAKQPRPAALCLVTAAEVEFRAVTGLLKDAVFLHSRELKFCRGRAGSQEVTVLISEIGAPGFADRLAAHLTAGRYDGVLVIGLAGGLDAQLRTGDVVIYDSCIRIEDTGVKLSTGSSAGVKRFAREEIAGIRCDPELSARLCAGLRSRNIRCRQVNGLSFNRIVVNAADKRALNEHYGAAVVDMETYQVLDVCARLNVPGAALRIVSDAAGHDLPDFNRALDRDGKMSGGRAALAMLARPVAALRFLFNLRRVMGALKQAAGAVADILA